MLKKRFFKTKDEVEVTFEWPQGEESSVAVAGDFNGWEAAPLKLNKKNKAYSLRVRLAKDSSFQFRYLIDNETWENDPAADDYVRNSFGSDNSLISTAAE
ncbi:1,4-alpha-glucan-branching protein [Vibrio sp. MACH09]|uniref:isoamylase early set domain-containing protein n=1 Tax=unclassified Vibrio TaxID=2614977 RepID=UPI001493390D|nr:MULTISPECIES: isoamylase early set domain-containing protein [unclassified Vibrio]NOI67805.1 1,4-alpha-glucan branching protein [Vibrio sp. 99-8-1]GLO61146.1 1,4-alpha-glucan-branching protein [Vibrio sp. MACH09]